MAWLCPQCTERVHFLYVVYGFSLSECVLSSVRAPNEVGHMPETIRRLVLMMSSLILTLYLLLFVAPSIWIYRSLKSLLKKLSTWLSLKCRGPTIDYRCPPPNPPPPPRPRAPPPPPPRPPPPPGGGGGEMDHNAETVDSSHWGVQCSSLLSSGDTVCSGKRCNTLLSSSRGWERERDGERAGMKSALCSQVPGRHWTVINQTISH